LYLSVGAVVEDLAPKFDRIISLFMQPELVTDGIPVQEVRLVLGSGDQSGLPG
jgi:hypothetical protein